MPDGSKKQMSCDGERFYCNNAKNFVIQPESWILDGGAIHGEPKGTTLKNIKISEDEAAKHVQQLLDDFDIEEFGVAEVSKARAININTNSVLSEGWLLDLTPTYSSYIAVDLSDYAGGLLEFDENEYVPRWKQELIQIYVTESGIESFSWDNRKELVEEITPQCSDNGF